MRLFHPRANSLIRLALAVSALLLIAAFGLGMQYYSSRYYTRVGFIHNQPVPFSHEHHVGGLGIDCRYCHVSVEKSSFAGMPTPSTCMHCHSQIWPNARMLEPVRRAAAFGSSLKWKRVHNLPDYVYFDHGIHVAKGIGCVTCHGRVNEMPLTWKHATLQMLWCMDCHRNPEKFIRPREEVFNMDWKPREPQRSLGARLVHQYGVLNKTDCYACHR